MVLYVSVAQYDRPSQTYQQGLGGSRTAAAGLGKAIGHNST